MEKHLRRNTVSFWVLVTFCTSTSAIAMTWADLKSAALSSAPTLQSAKTQIDAADANVDVAKSSFLPKISSSLSATRTIDSELEKTSNTYIAGINLEQSLFAFGKNKAQHNAAKANKDALVAELKSSSVLLRSNLAKAWANALYLQELVKITERNIVRREANYQIVKLRYSGGRENQGSVLKTETATLTSKTDSMEALANLSLSRGSLSILIGSDLSSDESLSGQLDSQTASLAPKNQRKNPSITAVESKLIAADESLKAARYQYFPELSFSASAKKAASPDLPLKDPIYAAGLTLTVPLFNPSTSASIKNAAAQKSAAVISLADARATLAHKVKATASAFDFAKQRLQVSLKNFDASKLQAEVSRQRYTLGLLSFQDWDSFESELIRSELEVLRCKKEVANALADFNEMMGVTLEEEP